MHPVVARMEELLHAPAAYADRLADLEATRAARVRDLLCLAVCGFGVTLPA